MIEEKENRQKLSNGYWLVHDNFSWWFSKECKSKNGKTTLRRVSGYHIDIADAFESLSVRLEREIEATSVTTLIKEVKALKSLVRELANDIRRIK